MDSARTAPNPVTKMVLSMDLTPMGVPDERMDR